MKTLKQTQKAKINQLVEKFNIAQQNSIRDIFQAYYNILETCINELNSYEYYIVGHNSNTFSMICGYIGKNGETRLRYWTAYNTYDCEVIE